MAQEDDREQRIRNRAYGLWQDAGSPEGRGEEFWRRAAEIENAQTTDERACA